MLRRPFQRRNQCLSRITSPRRPGVEALERRCLLTGAGGMDTSFGGAGIATRNLVTNEDATTSDTALQADGKIVAVGDLGQLGAGMFVARFTADGALDRSFGAGGGMVAFDFPQPVHQSARKVVIQPDQKILVAAEEFNAPALARFNPDGTLDTSFGRGGMISGGNGNEFIYALALQDDGRILVGGQTWGVGDPARGYYDGIVHRFTANGLPDASFGAGTSRVLIDSNGGNDAVYGLAALPDGRVIASGNTGISRFNADGSPDLTFGGGDGKAGGPGGPGDSYFWGDGELAVMPDGRLVVAGHDVHYALAVARYNPDGSPDATFHSSGSEQTPGVSAGVSPLGGYWTDLAVTPDGSPVVTGYNDKALLVRFTPTGDLDTSFRGDGVFHETDPAYYDTFTSVQTLPGGRLVVSGINRMNGNNFVPLIVLQGFTVRGDADPSFGSSGRVAQPVPAGAADHAADLLVQPDGKAVVVGTTSPIWRYPTDGAAVRFNPDGSPDTSFGTAGVARPDFGPVTERWYAVTYQPDGKLVLGGAYSDGGASPHRLLARLNANGVLDRTFGNSGFRDLGPGAITELESLPGGAFLAAGTNTVSRHFADGSLDPAFGTGGELTFGRLPGAVSDTGVNDLDALPDGRFYLLAQALYSNQLLLDPPAKTGTLLQVPPLLYRFNADGTFDTTFGNGGRADAGSWNPALSSIDVAPDGKVVAAGPGPGTRGNESAVARFNPDGHLDPTFGSGGTTYVSLGSFAALTTEVAVDGDGRIVLGGYSNPFAAQAPFGDIVVARLNGDGSPDRWFGDHGVTHFDSGSGGPDVLYGGLEILPDGDILAAGSMTVAPDVPVVRPSYDFAVLRLKGEGLGVDAGGPYDVAEGATITAAGESQTVPGAVTSYAWDFDYDGSTFTADATGLDAVFSAAGLDGPSTRTIALRATDSEGNVTTDTALVRIANTAPALSITGAATANAREPYVLELSAIDPAPETLRWYISWGDGTSDNVPLGATSASHTYAEGHNFYDISAYANDEDGSYGGPSTRVEVLGANDAPTNITLTPSQTSMTEGYPFFTLFGTFEDADTADVQRVTIQWGDGSPDAVVDVPAGGLRRFDAAHVYADDNPSGTELDVYTITVTVHDGTASTVVTTPVTVLNVAPAVRLGADFSVPEHTPVNLTATVTDPGLTATEPLTYLWHVTSTNGQTVADGDQPGFSFTPDDNGTYTVRLIVTDDDGGTGSDTQVITVSNVPPTLTAVPDAPAVEGAPLTLRLGATDPGQDTITKWTINWGDGVVDTLPGAATQATHVYADGPRDYALSVLATDEDGTYPVAGAVPGGALDTTFGTGGRVVQRTGATWDMEVLPDGKFIAIDGGIPDLLVPWKLTRYNADGSIDTSFGKSGVVTVPTRPRLLSQALAVLPDGKILVVGFDVEANFQGQFGVIARYNPDGTPDPSFGAAGFQSVRFAPANGMTRLFDVALLPGGQFAVAGITTGPTSPVDTSLFVARFNADGTPDTTFGTGGKSPVVSLGPPANHVPTLLVQSDGKLVAAGKRYVPRTGGATSDTSRFLVARYNADGSVDSGFGTNGVVTALPSRDWAVRDLAQLPDGRLVAAGYAATGPATGSVVLDAAAVRLLPDGAPDPSFDGDGIYLSGKQFTDVANSVVVMPDGGLLLAGYAIGTTTATTGFQLLRVLSDGSPDAGFGSNGRVITPMNSGGAFLTPSAQSLSVLPGGRILAGGYGGFARYLPGGITLPVANVAPTATFYLDGFAALRFTDQKDPSPADTQAGFRYGFDFNNDGDFDDADLFETANSLESWHPFPFGSPGVYTMRGRITDKDGGFSDYTARLVIGGVADRHVFYNHSAFDGNSSEAGADDDAAIAPDKAALRAGAEATASSANVTGYDKGLNGVMVDIVGIPDDATLTANDFDFGGAAPPVSVTVRRGAGVNGSDRVTLIWRDYNPNAGSPVAQALANGWLTVTVKANARTGLDAPDVFSFGNLIGETGDGGGAAGWRVSALDLGAVKAALNTTATPSSSVDVNHDGKVNALDLGVLKRNLNRTLAPFGATPVTAPIAAAPLATPAPTRVADEVLGAG